MTGGRNDRGAWYRQSVIWLGASVFAASIAGCFWLIAVAERQGDAPLVVAGMKVLDMPLSRSPTDETRRP